MERDESLNVSQRVPGSPKFLIRMKARAEARKERIKLAEEERRKKLEEQKKKEEAARIKEEQEKRRLQQEALRETRRLREEQERNRARETEKYKKLNNIAEEFYRKYLLRHYLIEPLTILAERRNVKIQQANNHFRENLLRKVFVAWKKATEEQCRIKTERATAFYNGNLISRMFGEWKRTSKEESLKYQVARDFYDMKLLDKYLKFWQVTTFELRMLKERKEKLSDAHYQHKLKIRYLNAWKKFPKIAIDIKESEKRRDELRQIVQNVIPDFNPKQRGVAIED